MNVSYDECSQVHEICPLEAPVLVSDQVSSHLPVDVPGEVDHLGSELEVVLAVLHHLRPRLLVTRGHHCLVCLPQAGTDQCQHQGSLKRETAPSEVGVNYAQMWLSKNSGKSHSAEIIRRRLFEREKNLPKLKRQNQKYSKNETSRERPKSAPYLRLKNSKRTKNVQGDLKKA